ncbi:MAG: hypothetical protein ACYYK0_06725 [Candidatus Eutrophobiaceae bacterium]
MTFITRIPLFFLFIATLSQAESIEGFFKRQCLAGKQDACVKAKKSQAGREHGEWVDSLGEKFSPTLSREKYEKDNRPLLAKAYPVILENYYAAWRQRSGKDHQINYGRLDYCSKHYHDYWLNYKMIWPMDEHNRPEWRTIYFFIVEHYHGFCLRK